MPRKPKTLPPRVLALAALAEAKRREEAVTNGPAFLDESFPAQSAFITDPSRMKMALCTARAGKSMGAALYLIKECWETPGVSCLYISLTRESAKRILWDPCLKVLDRKLGLNLDFNDSTLSVRFPNGSILYLNGADSDPKDAEKFLGQKFRLVVIDESASFKQSLDHIVYTILKPRMSDLDGTICLIGTPSNLKRGLFYRVTSGKPAPEDAKWSVHKWSQSDNPHMAAKYAAELAQIDVERPLFKETPQYKQHYLGLWEVDDSKLVYRFNPERNTYSEIPPGDYSVVLGVDLGSTDDTAIVALAYSEHNPTLYCIDCFKQPNLDFFEVAALVKTWEKRYSSIQTVVDGANKQGVETMNNRLGLSLISADKRGKAEHIDILNGEMIQGRIQIHEDVCKPLQDEWDNLIWDERTLLRTGKRVESSACANHLADAFLYAWRHTHSYLATPAAVLTKPGTPEWFREQEERIEEEADRRYRERENPNDFPGTFDPFPG